MEATRPSSQRTEVRGQRSGPGFAFLVLAILAGFLGVAIVDCRHRHEWRRAMAEDGSNRVITIATQAFWMGHPMFFVQEEGKPGNFHWADDVDFGLASNGMVIWKRVTPPITRSNAAWLHVEEMKR